MPDQYTPQNDMADFANSLSQGSGALTQTLHQLAALHGQRAYQAAMLAQRQAELQRRMILDKSQMDLNRAHTKYYEGQAGNLPGVDANNWANALAREAAASHSQAQAGEINNRVQNSGVLGDVIEALGKQPASAGNPMPAWTGEPSPNEFLRSIALGAAAKIAGSHPANIAEQTAQILQMPNPRMQQLIATGTKATDNVPAGATALDNVTQQPIYASPRSLNQGQVMVPGEGGNPIASGLPPRVYPGVDGAQKEAATLQALFRTMTEAGWNTSKNPEEVTAYKNVLGALNNAVSSLKASGAKTSSNVAPKVSIVPGTISKGYRYKGGDPADKNNWEVVK